MVRPPDGTRARGWGHCEASGSPPPILPSNNGSAEISRRCRSRKFLTSRLVSTSNRPRTARASPVFSTVRLFSGMFVRHEHNRDLRQLCVVAQGRRAGGSARSLGLSRVPAEHPRTAPPAVHPPPLPPPRPL